MRRGAAMETHLRACIDRQTLPKRPVSAMTPIRQTIEAQCESLLNTTDQPAD
jgi:hypothetical protein